MRYCRREVVLSRKLDYLMSISLFCRSKIQNCDIDMKIYMRQSIKMMTVGQSIQYCCRKDPDLGSQIQGIVFQDLILFQC